jgi:L-methionine (R)-S-oxide reductase
MDRQQEFLAEFELIALSANSARQLMQHISDRLHAELARYNWVGFYLTDPSDPNFLLLGPYSGTFTPHVRIPLNQGLCGAAASTGKTIVVNDVTTDPRYLSGSEHTKSEIIVPVSARGRVVAELDINSYFKNTWDAKERQFVEQCAALVARRM